MTGERVVVAMSGGVDSSVAALLLKEAGYDVIGISMQVWDYRNHRAADTAAGCVNRATCCAPDDFTDARTVAHRIGVPYYVYDFEELFRERVIEPFAAFYRKGLTPNPCVDCNAKVKFSALRERSKELGARYVATGHYARISPNGAGSSGLSLLRGTDADKDQSYFLYNLKQEELSETLFPVGGMTKPEVREIAKSAGLVTAEKPESQDICFVSGSVGDFLVKIGGTRRAGLVRSTTGEVLGKHEGIEGFTVGQRRGIGIGGVSEPLYVVEIRPEEGEITVGPRSALERTSFIVSDVHWIAPPPPIGAELTVQLRHRHRGDRVRVVHYNEPPKGSSEPTASGVVELAFVDSWSPISPGQAAVFYDYPDNQEVIGGGRVAQRQSGGSAGTSA